MPLGWQLKCFVSSGVLNDCWHANLFLNVPASTDPCKDSENSLNTICRVQAVTRQPQLYRPPESCRPESEPLCASDGHTYPSECAMTATGVQKGISLRKIHARACGKSGKRNSLKESESLTGLAYPVLIWLIFSFSISVMECESPHDEQMFTMPLL